ncbi:putative potassium antiporter CHAC-1 [Operophtera brumata]|uniref:glutathione-specific gamma-glutamylcyclotransferase n=1 Tax=Operophtera brumata TaxID=104452 RepID=A0A0L7LJC0_OPEBR|nr:putative potassium antiporter CHAC-1 [Operophtera brumata]
MWVFGYGSLVWKVDFKYELKVPGRVVTLIPSADSISEVWGVAYKIREQDIEEVTDHLDFREKNGTSQFLRPASIESIAKQVVSCHGPSGTNKEYVYNLAAAMRQLAPQITDDHLFELEAAILT